MDSGALLDLLGNKNRRRILRLLANKPCYVTEISEQLGVSPKAVIDHLRKLEEAGLVESQTDDRRRKYFSIARNVRLEVQLSPHGFGTKRAYPASPDLDLTRCSYLSVELEVTGEEQADPTDLADRLVRLEQLERELSMVQRWVQGQMADTKSGLADAVDGENGRFLADVLATVASGTTSIEEVASEVDVPMQYAESALRSLADRGLIERTEGGWRLA
ncbi:MAG: metalloregulator ArsR/SmtB family transcription factor [Halobacteriaceae archaeon]